MKRKTKPVLLIGSSNDCSDLEYASGFRAVSPVVFLMDERRRYLIVPQLEHGRAQKNSQKTEVLTPGILGLSILKRRDISQWVLALLKKVGKRTVKVSSSFPYGVACKLKRHGISIVIAKAPLFPERAVKSRDEIKKIEETQQAAVIAMRTAIAIIENSKIDEIGYLRFKREILTSEYIQCIIAKVLMEHNCFCRETIVAGGLQAADPHKNGDGPLRAREAIVIDIFPQHKIHGYWGDITRTVVKGVPSRKLKRLYLAVKSAHTAALKHVKAGVKCATVHKAATEKIIKLGFKTEIINNQVEGFIHSTGHGVGLAIHEEPSLGITSDGRLRSGNIVTIEPGLYYQDIGGIRIEDTIEVTPAGWRYLIPCEKKFIL